MTTLNIAEEKGFQEAIKWTRHQLNRINDGGVWVIPRSGLFIRVISHTKLEADVIGGDREPGVLDIMRAMGWRITQIKSGEVSR